MNGWCGHYRLCYLTTMNIINQIKGFFTGECLCARSLCKQTTDIHCLSFTCNAMFESRSHIRYSINTWEVLSFISTRQASLYYEKSEELYKRSWQPYLSHEVLVSKQTDPAGRKSTIWSLLLYFRITEFQLFLWNSVK